MGTITTGVIALLAGLVLAGATAVGVVQTQQSAGQQSVDATTVNYGSN